MIGKLNWQILKLLLFYRPKWHVCGPCKTNILIQVPLINPANYKCSRCKGYVRLMTRAEHQQMIESAK